MSTRTACDMCHREEAFRVKIDVSTSGGDQVKGLVPRIDTDLCGSCAKRLLAILKAAVPESALH